MKSKILGKYWNQNAGMFYALIYRFGMIYTMPYNLAIAN